MDVPMAELDRALVLDGNAVAGMLIDAFGSDMTDAEARCDHCGSIGVLATLIAYTRTPGIVLRCRICREVVLRMVETPTGLLVDARGATYVGHPRAL
jgi:hypothetical protein